jgi:hypothetical protein
LNESYDELAREKQAQLLPGADDEHFPFGASPGQGLVIIVVRYQDFQSLL